MENGCAGSGCTNTVETYTYNNRLQPVMIEVGNTSNASADYCLVYNYYPNVANPTGCAVPAQGGSNRGNVIGVFDQDNANSSLSHTEAYSYDALNRLTQALATGNSTYNFTFNFDRWGNMTCVINGNTNGPCPQYSFNSANNQITNSGFTYDAAGNLTQDSSTNPAQTYQWDAEGRLATVLQNGSTYSTSTFDAFGQAVERVWPPYSLTADEVRDLAGRELGDYNATHGQWWDRDIRAVGRMIGQSLPGETYFLHANLLNSDTQITDYGGSVHTDFVYYPWQMWKHAGSLNVDAHFAGFEQSAGPNYGTPTRTYSGGPGRWLTPDPLGGDITNPQSLNRYAYALNNPTTLTDPSGLTPWLLAPAISALEGLELGSGAGGGNPFGVECEISGLDTPCGIVSSLLSAGAACINSCSSTATGSNGKPYTVVQTAGPTVYVGPNGEELSDASIAEVGLPPLNQFGGLGMGLGPTGLGVGAGGGSTAGGGTTAGCPAKILGAFNAQFGTNAPLADITNLGAPGHGHVTINIAISFPIGTLAYGSVHPGRFGGGTSGIGPSLHVVGFSVVPSTLFANGLADAAITHLDEGNAFKPPFGTLSHAYYVLTHSAGPCP